MNYCRLHPIPIFSINFLLLSLITTLVSNCYPIVRHNHKHYITQQYILYIMLQHITPYHCRIVNIINHYIASMEQPYAEMINVASFQCCFFSDEKVDSSTLRCRLVLGMRDLATWLGRALKVAG